MGLSPAGLGDCGAKAGGTGCIVMKQCEVTLV